MAMLTKKQNILITCLFIATTFVLCTVLSFYKFWLVFFALPTLLVCMPLIIWAQLWSYYATTIGVARLRIAQLASFVVMFLFVPGAGDTDTYFLTIPINAAVVGLISCLSIVAGIAFIACTVLLFVRGTHAKRRARTPQS